MSHLLSGSDRAQRRESERSSREMRIGMRAEDGLGWYHDESDMAGCADGRVPVYAK